MCDVITLVDLNHNVVASACVDDKGGHYSGTISLEHMPTAILKVFEEYESLVNGQVLSLLDPVEERIDRMRLAAEFGDGHTSLVSDLQIFPNAGTISFKAVQQPARTLTA